jgi:type I restriction enzyme M protein
MSYLKAEHLERIAAAYRAFSDEPGFARAAMLDDIAAQDYSLSIPLYVRGRGVREVQGAYAEDGLKAAVKAWEQSSKKLEQNMENLLEILTKNS